MIWEYKTLALPSSPERQNMLSEMGLSGWELIGFEQGAAYFKRERAEHVPLPSLGVIAAAGIPTEALADDLSVADYHSPAQPGKQNRKKK